MKRRDAQTAVQKWERLGMSQAEAGNMAAIESGLRASKKAPWTWQQIHRCRFFRTIRARLIEGEWVVPE